MADKETDSAKLDAWLAGELSPDEARALELSFEATELPAAPEDELLLDLDQTSTGRAIGGLVDRIKTISSQADDAPNVSDDSWRELLEASDKPGVLGLLGDYEIIGAIASGGMATVLRARDPKLDRDAALKVLPPELAANRQARERFVREARDAARLEHENILPIYAVHESDHSAYYAMRFVPTGSLQDALDRGEEFPQARLEAIARGVASALATAHRAGIFHRDIKPANILLGENGDQLWVCDFGIARRIQDPAHRYGGTISGTPQYMSPEQAAGEILDGRSDLFSLGAVLYRCATGEPAFTGETVKDVFANLANTTPRPISHGERTKPAWLSELITGLLAKEPADRPCDANEVLRRIDHSRNHRSRLPWIAALAALAIAIAVATGLALLMNGEDKPSITQSRSDFFTIADRPELYADLPTAIAAAGDGDQIKLPGGAPISLPEIHIAAGKALTLTSAENSDRAIIRSSSPGGSIFVTASPIHLQGIDFEILPQDNPNAVIRIDGEQLTVSDCTFTSPDNPILPAYALTPVAIELKNGADAEIRACEFAPGIVVPVRITGAGDFAVGFEATRAIASSIVHVPASVSTAPSKVTINATSCDFSADRLFEQHEQQPIGVSIEVADCRLAVGMRLAWFNAPDPQSARGLFTWKGRGNSFPLGNAQAYFGAPSQWQTALLVELMDAPASSVEIAGSDQKYPFLAEAIAAAPDGATLLLSGRFEIEKEIVAPRGKALELRAAEGAQPSISTRLQRRPMLRFYGPTTLSGIRFVRHDPLLGGLPIVSIHAGGGAIKITDCEFAATPSNLKVRSHRGLGLSEFSAAEIHRSYFQLMGGTSIATGSGAGELSINDSLIISLSGIEVRPEAGDPAVQMNITRSVLLCRDGILRSATNSTTRLDVDLRENLFYVLVSAIVFTDTPASSLPDCLTWHSSGNFVRAGSAFLRTVKSRPTNTFVPLVITSEADLIQHFPDRSLLKSEDDQYGKIFDFGQLPLPLIAPDKLPDALDPSIESTAIKTLQHFAERIGEK